MSAGDKKIVIIAGPNGAGKTTFARECLPAEVGCPVFVNADLFAAALSPFQPEAAAFHARRKAISGRLWGTAWRASTRRAPLSREEKSNREESCID